MKIELRVFGNFDGKNQMLYCDPMEVYDNELGFAYPDFSHYDGEVEELITMPFIDKLDKNSKKIYAGDIIRSWFSDGSPCIHLIEWDSETSAFMAIFKNSKEKSTVTQGWINTFSKEIIGNVHESPEILT